MYSDNRDRYALRKKMERLERQNRFRLASGMLDFISMVAGVACVLILLALLLSLVNWLRQDISSTFAIFQSHFEQ